MPKESLLPEGLVVLLGDLALGLLDALADDLGHVGQLRLLQARNYELINGLRFGAMNEIENWKVGIKFWENVICDCFSISKKTCSMPLRRISDMLAN